MTSSLGPQATATGSASAPSSSPNPASPPQHEETAARFAFSTSKATPAAPAATSKHTLSTRALSPTASKNSATSPRSSAATHPAPPPTKNRSPAASTASSFSTTALAGGSSASCGTKNPPPTHSRPNSPLPRNSSAVRFVLARLIYDVAAGLQPS